MQKIFLKIALVALALTGHSFSLAMMTPSYYRRVEKRRPLAPMMVENEKLFQESLKMSELDDVDSKNKQKEQQYNIKLPSEDVALENVVLSNEILCRLGNQYGVGKELGTTCRALRNEFPFTWPWQSLYKHNRLLVPWQKGLDYYRWVDNRLLLRIFTYALVCNDIQNVGQLSAKLRHFDDISDDNIRIRKTQYKNFLAELISNDREEAFKAIITNNPFEYENNEIISWIEDLVDQGKKEKYLPLCPKQSEAQADY